MNTHGERTGNRLTRGKLDSFRKFHRICKGLLCVVIVGYSQSQPHFVVFAKGVTGGDPFGCNALFCGCRRVGQDHCGENHSNHEQRRNNTV